MGQMTQNKPFLMSKIRFFCPESPDLASDLH